MNGVYFDKTGGHYRVRINANGIEQKHLGTTQCKEAACAMHDLFAHLNNLQDSLQLNYPRMIVRELYELIEESDSRALTNLMKKSDLMISRNESLKKQEK